VALEPSRPEIEGRPTIIALPAPKPYGDYGKIPTGASTNPLPGAVGAFVDWLINKSGWTGRRRAPSRSDPAAAHRHSFPSLPEFPHRRYAGHTFVRLRRGVYRTCSSAVARSMIARRSWRYATP